MKEGISTIIGMCTLVFMSSLITSNIPDSFLHGGIYFDIHPIWMEFVFILGIIVISAFSAFVIGSIVYAILEREYIKMRIKELIRSYKERNTYKFNNNIREEKRKPTIMF